MNIVEHSIDLDGVADSRATGSVIISDVNRTLIRPAVPGQDPASVKHDSRHAYQLLDMADLEMRRQMSRGSFSTKP